MSTTTASLGNNINLPQAPIASSYLGSGYVSATPTTSFIPFASSAMNLPGQLQDSSLAQYPGVPGMSYGQMGGGGSFPMGGSMYQVQYPGSDKPAIGMMQMPPSAGQGVPFGLGGISGGASAAPGGPAADKSGKANRPFRCEVCFATFKQRYHLIRHRRGPRACQMRAIQQEKSREEQAVVNGVDSARGGRVAPGKARPQPAIAVAPDEGDGKRYQCLTCDRRFKHRHHLLRHIRSPYGCTFYSTSKAASGDVDGSSGSASDLRLTGVSANGGNAPLVGGNGGDRGQPDLFRVPQSQGGNIHPQSMPPQPRSFPQPPPGMPYVSMHDLEHQSLMGGRGNFLGQQQDFGYMGDSIMPGQIGGMGYMQQRQLNDTMHQIPSLQMDGRQMYGPVVVPPFPGTNGNDYGAMRHQQSIQQQLAALQQQQQQQQQHQQQQKMMDDRQYQQQAYARQGGARHGSFGVVPREGDSTSSLHSMGTDSDGLSHFSSQRSMQGQQQPQGSFGRHASGMEGGFEKPAAAASAPFGNGRMISNPVYRMLADSNLKTAGSGNGRGPFDGNAQMGGDRVDPNAVNGVYDARRFEENPAFHSPEMRVPSVQEKV
eukprot:Opistho-2@36459